MSLTQVKQSNIDESASQLYGMRNRIINGDMRIDQRNAGAAVTANASYLVDRWKVNESQGLGFSSQRSTTAPAGYSNSLSYTVTGTGTVTGTNNVRFTQAIEGYNTADLAFGTASGKPVTISFNVRSSLTGTFCVAVWDSSPAYSYVTEYTIDSANTWETKSVTIPAPTSGTWNTDNSIGLILLFDLGSGPDRATTADTWQSGLYSKTSNQVQMHDTNGATFYITGVQLEAGSVATPFERRPYGTELQLAQRYYQTAKDGINAPAFGTSNSYSGGDRVFLQGGSEFKVDMRAAPTLTFYSYTAAVGQVSGYSSGTGYVVSSTASPDNRRIGLYLQLASSPPTFDTLVFYFDANAEL
jgi:hypothetical protein